MVQAHSYIQGHKTETAMINWIPRVGLSSFNQPFSIHWKTSFSIFHSLHCCFCSLNVISIRNSIFICLALFRFLTRLFGAQEVLNPKMYNFWNLYAIDFVAAIHFVYNVCVWGGWANFDSYFVVEHCCCCFLLLTIQFISTTITIKPYNSY